MVRTYTKIGDVFSAKTDENTKKYFQLIAYDLTQLNSDVIRVFKEQYPINSNHNLSKIVSGEIEFYIHCTTYNPQNHLAADNKTTCFIFPLKQKTKRLKKRSKQHTKSVIQMLFKSH